MLYNTEISETCEKRMVKLNCYDIKSLLEGIDFIASFPQCGKPMQPRSDFRVFRIKKFRIHYIIENQTVRIISFSKNRDYSELL